MCTANLVQSETYVTHQSSSCCSILFIFFRPSYLISISSFPNQADFNYCCSGMKGCESSRVCPLDQCHKCPGHDVNTNMLHTHGVPFVFDPTKPHFVLPITEGDWRFSFSAYYKDGNLPAGTERPWAPDVIKRHLRRQTIFATSGLLANLRASWPRGFIVKGPFCFVSDCSHCKLVE